MTGPSRKNIYDEPAVNVPPRAPAFTEQYSSQLEDVLRSARHSVTAHFASTRIQIQSLVGEWLKVEQRVRDSVGAVAAPGEKLLPGALYVTIFGFAGSILSKNRGLLVRLSVPTAFTVGAFSYFYPGTAVNILKRSKIEAVTTDAFRGLIDSAKGAFSSSPSTQPPQSSSSSSSSPSSSTSSATATKN